MTNTLTDPAMIAPADISFVVQGGLAGDLTKQCLQSIRAHFPGATIILSTWAGSDAAGLDCDELVLSQDPGAFYYNSWRKDKLNNVNRQIVSTQAGLRAVKTRYAFKIRTDFLLSGNGFLNYWDMFPASGEGGGLFSHKILACCYFSRNPHVRETPYPLHLSDLAFFGEASDLNDLFDIPLMPEAEAYWAEAGGHNRYTPEQYILVSFLQRRGRKVPFRFYNDFSPQAAVATEKCFASNFVFLTFGQFALSSPKEHFSVILNAPSFHTCYTHNEWLELYKKHADPAAVIPAVDEEREEVERRFRRYRRARLAARLLSALIMPRERRRKIRARILSYLVSV